MTRIGIMTFLHNDNYGSTLQAWALQKTLEELGFEAEDIDYRPSSLEKIRNLVTSGNSPALILDGLRKRRVKAGQAGARDKSASFGAFYAEHMRLSPSCADHTALKAQAGRYDMLLCGSDQVWSPVWLNPAYFLDFAGDRRRIAYAASLGVAAMPEKRKAKRIEALTRGFAAVSVREEEGAALMEKMTGRRPDVMPDPVCLMTRERWLALAKKKDDAKPCIVCYYIGRNSDYWTQVDSLSKQTGLDVVVLPVTDESYQTPYRLADGASPEEWLGQLAGAALVCTDSFHGTVFSALLGVPVQIMRRYREDDPESKNSRIDNLLRQLGVSGSRIEPCRQVDERLAQLRERGRSWLLASLRE